jgi:hypothetical protein
MGAMSRVKVGAVWPDAAAACRSSTAPAAVPNFTNRIVGSFRDMSVMFRCGRRRKRNADTTDLNCL